MVNNIPLILIYKVFFLIVLYLKSELKILIFTTAHYEKDKKRMWTDYGQCWDRQSLRKDFNPELTKSKVLHYNDRGLQ